MLTGNVNKAANIWNYTIRAKYGNICLTKNVQNAWRSEWKLAVHGCVDIIEDGILKDLDVCITDPHEISQIHRIK